MGRGHQEKFPWKARPELRVEGWEGVPWGKWKGSKWWRVIRGAGLVSAKALGWDCTRITCPTGQRGGMKNMGEGAR